MHGEGSIAARTAQVGLVSCGCQQQAIVDIVSVVEPLLPGVAFPAVALDAVFAGVVESVLGGDGVEGGVTGPDGAAPGDSDQAGDLQVEDHGVASAAGHRGRGVDVIAVSEPVLNDEVVNALQPPTQNLPSVMHGFDTDPLGRADVDGVGSLPGQSVGVGVAAHGTAGQDQRGAHTFAHVTQHFPHRIGGHQAGGQRQTASPHGHHPHAVYLLP